MARGKKKSAKDNINAGFWRLIEKRRKQPTVTMAEMRRRVGAGRAQSAKGR